MSTPPKILVVEDNAIVREGTGVVLRQAGYAADLASDGTAALALLRQDVRPDLILLDMMLPGRDGWAVLEELRRDPALAGVPVLILTGLGIASTEWAVSLGATEVLRKPVEAAALLEAVGRHVIRPSGGT